MSGSEPLFRAARDPGIKEVKFAPTDSEEQRIILVRFDFTRAGITARANSLQ
jgi:hypothetical protein